MAGTADNPTRADEIFARVVSGTVGNTPSLQDIAESALAMLADSRPSECGDEGWHVGLGRDDAAPIAITLTGPDLPATVPDRVAPPELVAKERPWIGTHRLVVRAPLKVLDLWWIPGSPLRIMSWSRGDWEYELIAGSHRISTGP